MISKEFQATVDVDLVAAADAIFPRHIESPYREGCQSRFAVPGFRIPLGFRGLGFRILDAAQHALKWEGVAVPST